jgi:hypothetical protein
MKEPPGNNYNRETSLGNYRVLHEYLNPNIPVLFAKTYLKVRDLWKKQ